jgi:hypothetical protein
MAYGNEGLIELSKILEPEANDFASAYSAFSRHGDAFEIYPIILVDGIAENGMAYMQDIFIDRQKNERPFVIFTIESGASYFDISTSDYPFYDSTAASNNSFENERLISYRMNIRKTGIGDISIVQTKLDNFWNQIERHRQMGGHYTLVTQAGVITECILMSAVLISDDDLTDYACAFSLTFKHILLSTAKAESVYNDSMKKRFRKEPDLLHIKDQDKTEYLFNGIH